MSLPCVDGLLFPAPEMCDARPNGQSLTQGGSPAACTRSSAGGGAVSIRNDILGSRSGSFLFDHRDTDLRMLSIARLVAKIKNVSRKAKPFRALLERPVRRVSAAGH